MIMTVLSTALRIVVRPCRVRAVMTLTSRTTTTTTSRAFTTPGVSFCRVVAMTLASRMGAFAASRVSCCGVVVMTLAPRVGTFATSCGVVLVTFALRARGGKTFVARVVVPHLATARASHFTTMAPGVSSHLSLFSHFAFAVAVACFTFATFAAVIMSVAATSGTTVVLGRPMIIVRLLSTGRSSRGHGWWWWSSWCPRRNGWWW